MHTNKNIPSSKTIQPATKAEPKGFWQEDLTLGTLKFPRFLCAPLDGITDSPFRQIIRDFSPRAMMFGEMTHVCATAHHRNNPSLRYAKIEHPLGYQFSANRTAFMEEAIEKVLDQGFDSIDLNSGCPAKAVVRSGSGVSLMADLPRAIEIMKRLKKIINGRVPFTVKMRAGMLERNAVDYAMAAQDCGAQMLTIHPRTRAGGFTDRLDTDLVARVKAKVSVPLIFSGNVVSFARAQKMHDMTGIDGVLIGRAIWGAPWKIAEMMAHSRGEEFNLTPETAVKCALKHLQLNLAHYGLHGLQKIKKQLPQYIRGVHGAAAIRSSLLRINDVDEMQEQLNMLANQ